LAESRGVELTELETADFQTISPHFGLDVINVFDIKSALAARNITGGTSPEALEAQLRAAAQLI
jgi:argininosuccinate lyase